jgi:hypothetical protein
VARRNSSPVFFCRLISYPAWNYRVFGVSKRREPGRSRANKPSTIRSASSAGRLLCGMVVHGHEKRCNACWSAGTGYFGLSNAFGGGCIRSIQHSVLTTDGAGGESPAPFGCAVCLELNFANAGFSVSDQSLPRRAFRGPIDAGLRSIGTLRRRTVVGDGRRVCA